MRDVTLGDTIDFKFNTCSPTTGAPITLAGTPVISAYVGNSTTEITAGITLTTDFDGRTGLHNVRAVLTSGNGYTTGTDVSFVITTGTVDSVSAVGVQVYEVTIGRAITANVTQWHGSDLLTGTGPLAGLGVLDRGTAQSDSTTTLQLRSAAAFANDELIGATALIYSASTGAGQRSLITDYVGSTDTATIDTLVTDPTGTVRYEIYGTAASSGGGAGLDAAGVRAAIGLASANLDTQLSAIDNFVDTEITAIQSSLTTIAGYIDTEVGALTTAVAAVQSDTNDIQARLPAALVSGRMDASVGAMAANVMTAAATAADFVAEVGGGSGASAADVVTALYAEAVTNPLDVNVVGWNGATVDPMQDAAEIADVLLSVPQADYVVAGTVGASLNKAGQMVFTKSGEVDANVQSINGVTITGNGSAGNEFSV